MLANLSLFCIRLCGRPSPSISFLYDIGMEGKLLDSLFFMLILFQLGRTPHPFCAFSSIYYITLFFIKEKRKKRTELFLVESSDVGELGL